MSWQQFKSIGEKLHADLLNGTATGVRHKPSHVRATLKVLDGERLRGEIGPDGAAVGEGIAAQLRDLDPRHARQILAFVDALLTRDAMGKKAAGETDKLYQELRGEFSSGALRMILTAASKAGNHPVGKPDHSNE